MASTYDLNWPVAGPASSPVSPGGRANFLSLAQSVYRNLTIDSEILTWSGGRSAIPRFFALEAGTPAITQAGLSQTDTVRYFGPFSFKLVANVVQNIISKDVFPSTVFGAALDIDASVFQGQKISVGAAIRATTTLATRISIFDGVSETESTLNAAANTWEWKTVTHTLNVAADRLQVRWKTNANQTAYLGGGMNTIFGPVPPQSPSWSLWIPRTYSWIWQDVVATGDDALGVSHIVEHSGLVRGARASVLTAPTTTPMIFQFDVGGADLFDTRPQVNAAATTAELAWNPLTSTSVAGFLTRGDLIKLDIDQVGAASTPLDATFQLHTWMATVPINQAIAFTGLS